MATAKPIRKFRSWSSVDSVDPNDVRRLCNTEDTEPKTSSRFVSTWTFSLIILIIAVFLLVGLFVGYYVRESQPYDKIETVCDLNQRSDGLDQDQLRSVHENIVYFMSSEKIRQFAGDLKSSSDQTTGSVWDRDTADFVKNEFEKYRLDKVELRQYNVVVTYPNPELPNQLEIINITSGHTHLNVNITDKVRSRSSDVINNEQDLTPPRPPFVAFSPSGVVQGHLVYGNYGRKVDMVDVQNCNISTKDVVLLLRLGRIPISEKIKIAADAGAIGAVLYRDPDDTDFPDLDDYTPYTSGKPYGKDFLPIPTQTVSLEVAKELLNVRESGIVASDDSTRRLSKTYQIKDEHGSLRTGALMIKLTVNNLYYKQQVTNVIGSVYGDMEADSFIVIGASRTKFPDSTTDVRLGTAHLLEMAHTFSEIKSRENWRPRRGIRFCSWGGSELSHIGLEEYLRVNQHLFPKQTVAYIDLDLSIRQSRSKSAISLDVTSSPALTDLIQTALEEIPDPSYKQFSLADRQMKQRQNTKDVNRFDDDDDVVLPLVKSRGVAVVKARYELGGQVTKESSDVLHDSEHHYKYHLAAARVMSLVILRLMDDDNLAFNMVRQTKYLGDALRKSLTVLSQLKSALETEKIDHLLGKVTSLTRTAEAFEDYISTHLHTKIPLASHRMNEVKLLYDKIFVSPEKYKIYSPLLYHTTEDGDLSLIQDFAELASATGDWKEVEDLMDAITLATTEANISLQLS